MKMVESETDKELPEIFIYSNFSWQPRINRRGDLSIVGPFCSRCNTVYTADNSTCWKCGADYQKLGVNDIVDLRSKAHKVYEANIRSTYPVINFDIPPTSLSGSSSEDDNFFVGYKFGQQNGKKQLHIWVGEKMKNQGQRDKSQIILDIDKEELRYDQTNQYPGEIIAEAEVTFKKSKTKVDYSNKT